MDKAKQKVYSGVLKGSEFKNDLYSVLGPLSHCAWFFCCGKGR